MSELDANIVVDGQKAIATIAMTGDVVKDGGAIDATSVIMTESGEQKVVKTYQVGGGGGGGTSNYNDLSNKPQINGTTLSGNKTAANLGLQAATNVQTLTTASTQLANNTIYNGGELASVTLTLPNTVPADFIAQVEFTSGTTPTAFTAPASVYFNGDGCENGEFTAAANHRYCMLFISDGVNVLAFVYQK